MVLVVRIAWVVRLVLVILVIKFVNAYGLHGKVMQYSALAKFAMKVKGRVAGIDGTMVIADIRHYCHYRRRAVAYFFQAGEFFSTENAKFWPILAHFVYFLVNLALLGIILTGLNDAIADQK